jgi:DNA-binding beta-propeller fold protein YncE
VSTSFVFDPSYVKIGTGSKGNAIGQFNDPAGVALSPPSQTYPVGLLFVADTFNHQVQVFYATSSQYIRSIGTGVRGNGIGQLSHPYGVALLSPTKAFPDGLLFVSDCHNNRVQVFNLSTWALHRSITCDFNGPDGLAVLQPSKEYPEGLLFVGNEDSHCVKVLNAISGSHRFTIGRENDPGSAAGQLNLPRGIALQLPSAASPLHLLYVAEAGNDRVSVFNALTGEHVRMLGAGKGSGLGHFNVPYGVAVQPANAKYPGGAVYVAEWVNERVQEFNASTGQHLGILAGSQGKYARRIAVCSDSQGCNLVFVTNGTDHNLDVYRDA